MQISCFSHLVAQIDLEKRVGEREERGGGLVSKGQMGIGQVDVIVLDR